MSSKLPIALACVAFVCSAGRSARADDATAEALYNDGRRAAEAKNWELACAKFRESNERETAPGTLLNLADCEEKRGQLTSAIAHFEAASRLFHDDRAPFAKERANAADRRRPRVAVRLAAPAPAGATVERDGAVMAVAELGSPTPLDPGDHSFVVRAPGHAEVRQVVRFGEGERRDLELAAGPALLVPGTRARPSPAGPGATEPDVGPPPPPRTLRNAGLVSLGVSAAAVAVGTTFGILVLNAKRTTEAHCDQWCDEAGLEAGRDGKNMSVVSSAAFVTAGVALATGTVLLLLHAKRSRVGGSSAPAHTFVAHGMVATF